MRKLKASRALAYVVLLLLLFCTIPAQHAKADFTADVGVYLDPNNSDNGKKAPQWKLNLVFENIDLHNLSEITIVGVKILQNWTGTETVMVDWDKLDSHFPVTIWEGDVDSSFYLLEWQGPVPEPGVYNVTIILEWTEGWQIGPALQRTYNSEMQVLAPVPNTVDTNTVAFVFILLFLSTALALLIVRGRKRP
ncbi:MAG: hypothetical protein LUQ16_06785 [Methanomassiliicoccales archaeon]|nr:hypothetical protein [Methanomassiliicoccales archaeon]MDD1757021.1 hypothetical protein [Methanomassiliicoccales archaeon]